MTKTMSSDLVDIVLSLTEDIATPRALTVAILVRYSEWDQLAILRCDPEHYLLSGAYWGDNLVTELLRKNADLATTFDTKVAAEETFLLCEKKCFRSNQRLENLLFPHDRKIHEKGDLLARSVFDRARKIVSDCLGRFPFELIDGKFGPGATFGDKGGRSTIPDKMSSEPTFTPSAWTSLSSWRSTAWARACAVDGRSPQSVRGNRFLTVPKDCTKDRGIAVEPSINVFYQLAVGGLIRSRLRRLGLDLVEGQTKHRSLSCAASSDSSLCTLDLSNASDTICRKLVEFLLPPSWYGVLSGLRSSHTLFKGRYVLLEKFSSMGNGFTFELETLIFYSLVTACCELRVEDPFVSVYGDDILAPTDCSQDVIAFLGLAGFEVNSRKSFSSGYFRESCGGDYFNGYPVRAHYLKSFPSRPDQFIALANGLRRSADHRFAIVYRTWRRILDRLPVEIRSCRGPQELGDIVIHDDEPRWNFRRRNSIRYIRTYRPLRGRVVPWRVFQPDVILASALYGLSSGDSFRILPGRTLRTAQKLLGVTPRSSVSGHKLGWVPYS